MGYKPPKCQACALRLPFNHHVCTSLWKAFDELSRRRSLRLQISSINLKAEKIEVPPKVCANCVLALTLLGEEWRQHACPGNQFQASFDSNDLFQRVE